MEAKQGKDSPGSRHQQRYTPLLGGAEATGGLHTAPVARAPRQCCRHIAQVLSWSQHPNFHRHHPNRLLEMQSSFRGYKIKFRHSGYKHIPVMPSWGYSWVVSVELKVFPEILQTTLKKCLLVYIFSIDSSFILISFSDDH